MATIHQDSWREGHELTKWPFRPDATLKSGDQLLDQGALVDAALHPPGTSKGLYLKSVLVSSTEVTFTMGDESADRCESTFDKVSPPDSLEVFDMDGQPAGVIIVDSVKLTSIQSWPIGDHKFRRTDAEFVGSVVTPRPEVGVRGVRVGGKILTGDVWIVGGRGVALQHSQKTESRASGSQTFEDIRVNLIGTPLYNRDLCSDNEDVEFQNRRFVQQVCVYNNGRYYHCPPGENGGIVISTGDRLNNKAALRIHTSATGLEFTVAGR